MQMERCCFVESFDHRPNPPQSEMPILLPHEHRPSQLNEDQLYYLLASNLWQKNRNTTASDEQLSKITNFAPIMTALVGTLK